MRTPALLLLAALLISCGDRAQQSPGTPSDSTPAANSTAPHETAENGSGTSSSPSALQDTGATIAPKKTSDNKSTTAGGTDNTTAERDEAGSLVRRVKFEKGRTTAVLKGNVKDGQEITYLLGAAKGQTMTVHLTGDAKNHDVVFSIVGPDGAPLMGEGEIDTDWTGELPAAGDYKIKVGLIESKSSAYTLEVMIR